MSSQPKTGKKSVPEEDKAYCEPLLKQLADEVAAALKEELVPSVEDLDAELGHCINVVQYLLRDPRPVRVYIPEGSPLGVGDATEDEADIIMLTEQEAEIRFASGDLGDKPIVIREPGKDTKDGFRDFLSTLRRSLYTGNETLDIQDVRGGDAKSMNAAKVLDQFEKNPNGRLKVPYGPYNGLNIDGRLFPNLLPRFLHGFSYRLLHHCNDRARYKHVNAANVEERKAAEAKGLGKRKLEVMNVAVEKRIKNGKSTASKSHIKVVRHQDAEACETFAICAQRGCASGYHKDISNGTGARNIFGDKLWFMPFGLTAAELEQFRIRGTRFRAPAEKLRYIHLRPGDFLIMPPGTSSIHAPLTLTDCGMTGGMFWSYKRIVQTLQQITFAAENLDVTNELPPAQLPDILDALEEEIAANPENFETEDMKKDDVARVVGVEITKLRTALSCDCVKCDNACPCSFYERNCTRFCHTQRTGECAKAWKAITTLG